MHSLSGCQEGWINGIKRETPFLCKESAADKAIKPIVQVEDLLFRLNGYNESKKIRNKYYWNERSI